jgi:hypothetical protein
VVSKPAVSKPVTVKKVAATASPCQKPNTRSLPY